MRKGVLFLLVIGLLSAFSAPAEADIVCLTNGRKLHGTILQDDKKFVTMQWGAGTVKWRRDEVSWTLKGSDDALALKQEAGKFFKEGDQSFQKGLYQSAAQSYEAVSKLEPKSLQVWNNLGSAYAKSGQYDKAAAAFERAAALEPGNRIVRENLGNAYASAGHHSKAALLFHGMLSGSDDKGLLYLKLSAIFYKNRTFKQSQKLYKAAERSGAVERLMQEGKNAQ